MRMPSFTPVIVLLVGSALFAFNSVFVKADTDFTNAEIKALSIFRPLTANLEIRDFQRSDRQLIKWLRAQNLDTKKALEMLHRAIEWRRDNHIDTILNETLFNLHPLPYSIEGLDREGRPIGVSQLTSWDFRKLLLGGSGAAKKLSRYGIQLFEVINGIIEEFSKRNSTTEISQMTLIVDAHGFNLRQHGCLQCVPIFLELFTILESYYPQLAAQAVMINLPRVGLPLLELIKPLLSPYTSSIIRVFSTDRKEWQAYLHKIIAPDQLSYKFGGTKKSTGTSGFEEHGLSLQPK